MSVKETLFEVAEKLPPDATLADAIYELEFRQAVQDGIESLDRGNVGSSRVDLQACKLEYSIVSPK